MRRRAIAISGSLIASILIAGCAIPIRARGQKDSEIRSWHGRLSVRVAAAPELGQDQGQSFSAAFELLGNPAQGDLTFFSPLGSTVAAIHWTVDKASLQANGETREFDNLRQLIQVVLGTDVPVAALFAWLEGQAEASEGWQVDLSEKEQGKITARRATPPAAELRVLLEP